MSKHPVKELEDRASISADADWDRKKLEWLWWQEYRAAYAKAVGLYDDIPAVPDAELQAYLARLDEKVRILRAGTRSA